MKILSKVPRHISAEFVEEQLSSTLYSLSAEIIQRIDSMIDNDKTIVLFSGGHRLPWPGVYIEAKMFQPAKINWKPNTIFVDPSNPKLIAQTIKYYQPHNILILNTNIFIGYRPWQDLIRDIAYYRSMTNKVIATIPLTRLDFNRLKYDHTAIADLMQADILDNTLIICH